MQPEPAEIGIHHLRFFAAVRRRAILFLDLRLGRAESQLTDGTGGGHAHRLGHRPDTGIDGLYRVVAQAIEKIDDSAQDFQCRGTAGEQCADMAFGNGAAHAGDAEFIDRPTHAIHQQGAYGLGDGQNYRPYGLERGQIRVDDFQILAEIGDLDRVTGQIQAGIFQQLRQRLFHGALLNQAGHIRPGKLRAGSKDIHRHTVTLHCCRTTTAGIAIEQGFGRLALHHAVRHLIGMLFIRVADLPNPTLELHPAALLHHMSGLVGGGMQIWRPGEHHMFAGGIGARTHRLTGPFSAGPAMGLNLADIVATKSTLDGGTKWQSAARASHTLRRCRVNGVSIAITGELHGLGQRQ